MSRPSSNILDLTNQSSSYNTLHYHRQTQLDTSTSSFYEFSSSSTWVSSGIDNGHGIELRELSNGTGVFTNSDNNGFDPNSVELVASGATSTGSGTASVTITSNDIGSELYFYQGNGTVAARHTITAGTLWSGGSQGSAPAQPSEPETPRGRRARSNFW